MKIFHGWVIVGAAMVITSIGFGAMFSLGVFLQPMSADTGWSRTGISSRDHRDDVPSAPLAAGRTAGS